MTHYNTKVIENSVLFRPLNYEHITKIPDQDISLLSEINLSINGQPTYLNEAIGSGLHDLHIYIKGNDITNSVIYVLKNKLDLADQNNLKSEYQLALDGWLSLEEKLGDDWPPGNILELERNIANTLVNKLPISKNINKLGDNSVGWNGNLHIINFLYKHIKIAPISLQEVIEHFNKNNQIQIIFSELGDSELIFSSGSCRLFANDWNPKKYYPSGVLNYRIEYFYKNPFIDQINDIIKRLTSLETQYDSLRTTISNRLKTIATQVGPNGVVLKILEGDDDTPIHRIGIKNQVVNINSQLNNCQKVLESLQTQMNEVATNSIPSLKNSIDNINRG